MKKIIAVMCLCSSGFLAADVLVEAQGAYYCPMGDRFNDIYSGSGIYGLEVSAQAWHGLYGWAGSSVFTTSGHSSAGSSSRVTFVPIGVGLKYFWKVKCADVYVGAGIMPTYLHIHDDSPYVVQNTSLWGCGGIAKLGAIFNVSRSFFIDVFTNYSIVEIPDNNTLDGAVYTNTANLNGFTFGVGIGYRFGA